MEERRKERKKKGSKKEGIGRKGGRNEKRIKGWKKE